MSRTVVALFERYDAAVDAVRQLEDAGISYRDISLLASEASGPREVPLGTTDDAARGAGTGAAIGSALGGGAGLLAGLGIVAIPGLGPMVAAGWLAATAAGAAAGAAAGGAVGALTGAGLSDEDAHIYIEGVRRGGTLVAARVDESQYDTALAILSRNRPVDPQVLGTANEKFSPSPLIESDRVEGTAVYDPNGKHIGAVKRLMLDKVTGRVAYVIISFGGFLGLGEQTQPVPWDMLNYDTDLQGYRTVITEEQLRGAPVVLREEEQWDRRRERELHDYYGARYYWEL